MSDSTNATTILKGSSRLINGINVKQGVNIDDIEKSMIERGLIQPSNEDPNQKWESELNNLADRLGISLNGGEKKKTYNEFGVKTTSISTPSNFSTSTPTNFSTSAGFSTSTPQKSSTPIFKPESFTSMNTGADADDESDDENTFSFSNNPPRLNTEQRMPTPMRSSSNPDNMRTEEQRRKEITNGVVDEIDENSFSLEKEKEEDLKSTMLEEIDELREILTDEGVDISRIEVVTRDDSFSKVNDVMKSLRYKNDSCRYRTMAEEFILFGANGLEEIFDGKRVWFNRYKPDLSGWSTQLNSKLRRMRTDTSRVVGGVMRDYDLGPGLRILLELVPNAFMYSRSKKRQSETPSIYNDADISRHISGIRDKMEN